MTAPCDESTLLPPTPHNAPRLTRVVPDALPRLEIEVVDISLGRLTADACASRRAGRPGEETGQGQLQARSGLGIAGSFTSAAPLALTLGTTPAFWPAHPARHTHHGFQLSGRGAFRPCTATHKRPCTCAGWEWPLSLLLATRACLPRHARAHGVPHCPPFFLRPAQRRVPHLLGLQVHAQPRSIVVDLCKGGGWWWRGGMRADEQGALLPFPVGVPLTPRTPTHLSGWARSRGPPPHPGPPGGRGARGRELVGAHGAMAVQPSHCAGCFNCAHARARVRSNCACAFAARCAVVVHCANAVSQAAMQAGRQVGSQAGRQAGRHLSDGTVLARMRANVAHPTPPPLSIVEGAPPQCLDGPPAAQAGHHPPSVVRGWWADLDPLGGLRPPPAVPPGSTAAAAAAAGWGARRRNCTAHPSLRRHTPGPNTGPATLNPPISLPPRRSQPPSSQTARHAVRGKGAGRQAMPRCAPAQPPAAPRTHPACCHRQAACRSALVLCMAPNPPHHTARAPTHTHTHTHRALHLFAALERGGARVGAPGVCAT